MIRLRQYLDVGETAARLDRQPREDFLAIEPNGTFRVRYLNAENVADAKAPSPASPAQPRGARLAEVTQQHKGRNPLEESQHVQP